MKVKCQIISINSTSDQYPNVHILRRGDIKEGCKQVYDKQNFCTFCEKSISSKISRHLLNVHKDQPRVSKLFILPKKSQQRNLDLEMLANEGNFKHNIEVLRKKEGCLVVARRDGSVDKRPGDYLPCQFCKKFILRASLWWHNRNCNFRKDEQSDNPIQQPNNAVRHGQHLLQSAVHEDTNGHVAKMLSRMKMDNIREIVESDALIKRYAALRVDSLGEEGDQKINDMYRVSQCCRTLARLVLEAKKNQPEKIITLDHLVKPESFYFVVQCTKTLALNNTNPALTLGKFIGNLLNTIMQIKVGQALRSNDDQRNQLSKTDDIRMELQGNFSMSHSANKCCEENQSANYSSN